MDASGGLTKFVLGAAFASTVISLPWLLSKLNNKNSNEDGHRSLIHSTSSIPEPPRQREVLFHSTSILPSATGYPDLELTPRNLVTPEADDDDSLSDEELNNRIEDAIEEEKGRADKKFKDAVQLEGDKYNQLLLQEQERHQTILAQAIAAVRLEEKQIRDQLIETAIKDSVAEKERIIEQLRRENNEKEELIASVKNEMSKVRTQLELLEQEIQSQQIDQQEQQLQKEIVELKYHEEDVRYQKAIEEIQRLTEEKDSYQAASAELADRMSGLKTELEQAHQQISTLSAAVSESSQVKQAEITGNEVEPQDKAVAVEENVAPTKEQQVDIIADVPTTTETTNSETVKPQPTVEDKVVPQIIVHKRPMSTVVLSARGVVSRHTVANELFNTERNYVNQLRLIQELFIQPLEDLCNKHSTCILTKEEIKSVFSDIPTIYQHNKQLAATLEEKIRDWSDETTTIGDVFIKIGSLLGYEEYCFHYASAVSNYNNLLSSNADFSDFIDSCHQKPEMLKLTLLDLLITPIQRMPRYVMLLQELLKYTSPDHTDFELLQEAIRKVKQQTERMNDVEKTAENINKISQVQQKLTGGRKSKFTNLVIPGRKYIREGDLSILELGKAKLPIKQKRYFFLFSDLLLETKPLSKSKVTNKLFKSLEFGKNEKYKFKRGFDVDAIESITDVSDPTNNKFAFQLKTTAGISFEAKVSEQLTNAEQVKDEWMVALNQLKTKVVSRTI